MLGISKQAVYQHKKREDLFLFKLEELITQVDILREVHPGCGVEKMYKTFAVVENIVEICYLYRKKELWKNRR